MQSSPRPLLLLACLALALCSTGFAQGLQPADKLIEDGSTDEVTQADLDRLGAKLIPLVALDFGSVAPPIRLRLASESEVRECLYEENRILLALQLDSEELVERTARNFAAGMAPFLLAKYVLGSAEVLVMPRNFKRLAKGLGMPELLDEEVLRAVLLHELVHAFDDSVYDIGETLMSLGDANRVSAMNAVMEGHAQHVTGRICAKNNWLAGFETFTKAISKSPAQDEDSLDAYQQRLHAATLIAYYVTGEAFIAAVERAAGREGVGRMLRSPPVDMSAVHEPRWALDPSLRPAARFALKAGLLQGLAGFKADDWTLTPVSPSKAQMLSAMSILGEGVGQQAVHSIIEIQGMILASTDPGQGQLQLSLLEFPSPAEAMLFGKMNETTLRAKEKLFGEQGVRLSLNSYAPVDARGLVGLINRKNILIGTTETKVVTLIASWDALCVEFSALNRSMLDEQLLGLALTILESCKALAPTAPAPK